MRKGVDQLIARLRWLLPTPFTIALLLTAIAFAVAFFSTLPELTSVERVMRLANAWEEGLWNAPLLVFAMQMMLMLVLGHTLALSAPVARGVDFLAQRAAKSTAHAAAMVCFFTLLMGLFNWGFGLVFGAILARQVAEVASRKSMRLNFPLIGAAGYSGMLIWHGGLSGSSLIKAAEPGHLESLVAGVLADEKLAAVPSTLGFGETAFSAMNGTATLALLLLLPAVLFWVGRRAPGVVNSSLAQGSQGEVASQPLQGAERLDHSRFLAMGFGALLLLMALVKALGAGNVALSFITPNWINLVLLGAALLLHGSVSRFLEAIDQAIGGASGILVQFPLYFGVMGLIVGSGLVSQFSLFMMQWSTTETYPLITFFSAAVVNVFVPSGGGQWALQGPLIVSAAMEMNVPLGKSILAMAYGDQLTNMLQPFWALPLLGITRLKAREIAPYTLLMMLVAGLVFGIVLLVF